MRKILSFLLVLVLLFSLVGCMGNKTYTYYNVEMGKEVSHYPVAIMGAEYMLYDNGYALIRRITNKNFQIIDQISYDGIEYTVLGVETGTTLVNGYGADDCPENLIFPDSMRNLNFAIRKSAVQSITVSENIESFRIELEACSNITEIKVPESCKLFGVELSWCDGIEEISCPADTELWGSCSFSRCKNLKKVIYPAATYMLSIKDGGHFSNCPSLVSVEYRDGAKYILWNTFAECPALETVIFPNTVIEMDNGVFYNCPSLKDITLSDALSDVPAHLFEKDGQSVDAEGITIRVRADMVDYVQATYPKATVVAK